MIRSSNKPHTPESFWALVDRSGECWEWQGVRNDKNYGQLAWAGVTMRAHRVAAWLSGIIPDLKFTGQNCVLHKCDNPPCCRPDHLFAGVYLDNIVDQMNKGRFTPIIGDRHPAAKMTEAQFAEALRRTESGEPIAWVAKDYGTSRQTLSQRIARHYRRAA